ncbi:MAG TPA: SDR family oxidoreductase [Gemmatimonadaceae bacterium]|nr:SDR family oxidoreductase [Gemmatimonadaceae bacterium]
MAALLAGRVALVTGASRGIGLATARALIVAGARVAMVARSADVLRDRARELGEAATPVACDLADREAVAHTAETLAREIGTPHILVNNAGLFAPAPLTELSVETFVSTVDLNLVAPFLLVHACLPRMRKRGTGHIVTIGSVADRTAFPGNAAYAASKFGVRALHEVMRTELRGSGLRTTLVSPGPTDTPTWNGIELGSPGRFPSRESMLHADAVAAAILYAVTQPPQVNVDELRLSRA